MPWSSWRLKRFPPLRFLVPRPPGCRRHNGHQGRRLGAHASLWTASSSWFILSFPFNIQVDFFFELKFLFAIYHKLSIHENCTYRVVGGGEICLAENVELSSMPPGLVVLISPLLLVHFPGAFLGGLWVDDWQDLS